MTQTGLAFKESSEDLVTMSPLSSESDSLLQATDYFSNDVPTFHSLWNVQEAINAINETYEINENLDAWNYRSHLLLSELTDQVRKYACSSGVWTQTTDVEGEVNGLLTYDRRILRTDEEQWKSDIKGLFDAASARKEPDSKMRMV